jgi:uncharacterized protein (TIGR03083 family)
MSDTQAMFLPAIHNEAGEFLAAARLGLDASVTSCPGWDVRTLVIHLGDVYSFIGAIVEAQARDYATEADPIHERLLAERARDHPRLMAAEAKDVLSWFAERATYVERVLSGAQPTETVWTWFEPEQCVGFWRRRMAHETAVHRWDTQQAHHRARPIDSDLARDGIDEALHVHLPERVAEAGTVGSGETFHFHCLDTEAEWFVRFDTSGVSVEHMHRKADIALRGTSSDMLLFLWQRLPIDEIDVVGDVSLASRWFELVPPE